jgi:hypothetical protein
VTQKPVLAFDRQAALMVHNVRSFGLPDQKKCAAKNSSAITPGTELDLARKASLSE